MRYTITYVGTGNNGGRQEISNTRGSLSLSRKDPYLPTSKYEQSVKCSDRLASEE